MTINQLRRAVLETLAYSDIFDQPLTLSELHRYLHGLPISFAALAAGIDAGACSGLPIQPAGDYFLLEGRTALLDLRAERESRSRSLWPSARKFGRVIGRLPFVRMVALTGALAVWNAGDEPDIDYLIVTVPERVWLSRLFVLFIVKFAARQGIVLCPNYFLTTRRLALADRSIFTARELAQMVPLSGSEVYAKMRSLNPWADALLPNASGSPIPEQCESLQPPSVAEKLFQGTLGSRLEVWEMNRKITRFQAQRTFSRETQFDRDTVQGHFNQYRAETLDRFDRRMAAFTHLL